MEQESLTLAEILRTLKRIEHRFERVTDDHETRLRRAERWIYALPPTLILAAASLWQWMMNSG